MKTKGVAKLQNSSSYFRASRYPGLGQLLQMSNHAELPWCKGTRV